MAKSKYHWKSTPHSDFTSTEQLPHLIFHADQIALITQRGRCPIEDTRLPFYFHYHVKRTIALKDGYYQPIEQDQPSFDSFLYSEMDRRAVVFQATVSETHGVKLEGLQWLKNQDGVEDIWFVVVTPLPSVDLILDEGVKKLVSCRFHIQLQEDDFARHQLKRLDLYDGPGGVVEERV